MSKDQHTLRSRVTSFRYAFKGIGELFRREPNARIHLTAAIVVIAAGFLLRISSVEWMFVVVAIGLVFAAEAFNTSIERLCDKVCAQRDPLIGSVKDVAAGAVLICAMAAVVIGLVVFAPRIYALFV